MQSSKVSGLTCLVYLVLFIGTVQTDSNVAPAPDLCQSPPGTEIITFSNPPQPFSGNLCKNETFKGQVQLIVQKCITIYCPSGGPHTCDAPNCQTYRLSSSDFGISCVRKVPEIKYDELFVCCPGSFENPSHVCVPLPTSTTTTPTTTTTTSASSSSATTTTTTTASPDMYSTTISPAASSINQFSGFPFPYIIAIVAGLLFLLLLLILLICCCCRRKKRAVPPMEVKPAVFVLVVPEPEKKKLEEDEYITDSRKPNGDYDDLDAIKIDYSGKKSDDVAGNVILRVPCPDNLYSDEPSRDPGKVDMDDGIYAEINDENVKTASSFS